MLQALKDQSIFLKKFLACPSTIGSITPSSNSLGLAIGKIVRSMEHCRIMEIGAGTGAITNHLADLDPTVIEIDKDFSEILSKKFPTLQIVNDCCLNWLQRQESPFGLVVSIPLINNPFRSQIITELQRCYRSGKLKWCVIYSYGLGNPLISVGFKKATRRKLILSNIPPANVWVFT
jgi:phosphatidylethanolamine/phosphatidyl-N-methylethanolamine N-methyltransferase